MVSKATKMAAKKNLAKAKVQLGKAKVQAKKGMKQLSVLMRRHHKALMAASKRYKASLKSS